MTEPRRPSWFRSAFRMSMRGVLIAVLVLAVWLGWWINSAREQQAALTAIRTYDTAANVMYDFQQEADWMGPFPFVEESPPWWPRTILERHLGPDYVHTVDSLAFGEGPPDAVRPRRPDILRDVARLSRLRQLSLYLPVGDADVSLLSRLRSLTSLELHAESPGLTDASLRTIGRMSNLEALSIHDAPVADAGLTHLAALPRLKSLTLGEARTFTPVANRLAVTGTGFAPLASLPSLTALEISSSALSGDGLKHVGALRHLTRLRIKGGSFSDDDLRLLGTLTNLESLEIVGSTIDGTGFRHLSGLPKLASVCVESPNVTDAAVPHLARLPALQGVMLYGTRVTAAGLETFQTSPRLKQMGLIPAVPGDTKRLKQRLPLCNINIQGKIL